MLRCWMGLLFKNPCSPIQQPRQYHIKLRILLSDLLQHVLDHSVLVPHLLKLLLRHFQAQPCLKSIYSTKIIKTGIILVATSS